MLEEDLARGSDFIISWLLPHFPRVSWLLSNLWPPPPPTPTPCFFSATCFLAFDVFPTVAQVTQRIVHKRANLRRSLFQDFHSNDQAQTVVLSGVDSKHKRVIIDLILPGWRSIMLSSSCVPLLKSPSKTIFIAALWCRIALDCAGVGCVRPPPARLCTCCWWGSFLHCYAPVYSWDQFQKSLVLLANFCERDD